VEARRTWEVSAVEQRYTPAVLAALAFTLAYTAAAGIGVVVTGDREFMVYLGVMAAAIAVVAGLHHRVGFSPALVWGLTLLGALHMAGGLVRAPEGWPVDGRRVLYNLWLVPARLRFDQVVHFYGAAVGTWACWQCLRAGVGLSRPAAGSVTLCALAGLGLGAVNEIAEFLTTRVVSDNNVGGFENTGWDLVANLAGATLAGLLIWACDSRTPPDGLDLTGPDRSLTELD
jgi:hypothetical protein